MLSREEVDSDCLHHNPTEAISMYDDDDDIEEIYHWESRFDPDSHPVSDPVYDDDNDIKEISVWESSFNPASHLVSNPGHVPTPVPSNSLSSIPCPNPRNDYADHLSIQHGKQRSDNLRD